MADQKPEIVDKPAAPAAAPAAAAAAAAPAQAPPAGTAATTAAPAPAPAPASPATSNGAPDAAAAAAPKSATESVPDASKLATVAPTTTTTTTSAVPTNGAPKFDDDPTLYIRAKIDSLIYWEKPTRSGAVFATLLGVLILTQYYSLLQIAAAFFTIVTGLNWVYVNTHKQGQRFFGGKAPENLTNPHSQRLNAKGTYIPRDRVVRTAQLTVDVIEVMVQELTKLVLIQDSGRSAAALGVSYFVWTLAKYISTKYLVGVFLVGFFSIPYVYRKNQAVIDQHVAQHSQKAYALAREYGGVASDKAKQLYDQAMATVTKSTKAAAKKAN